MHIFCIFAWEKFAEGKFRILFSLINFRLARRIVRFAQTIHSDVNCQLITAIIQLSAVYAFQ